MRSKDVYLWGCLFALIRDQLAAIDKQVKGELGLWGKTRAAARNKEIQKFIFELYARSANPRGESPAQKLLSDLVEIQQDKHTYPEITPQEADYVRNILAQLE